MLEVNQTYTLDNNIEVEITQISEDTVYFFVYRNMSGQPSSLSYKSFIVYLEVNNAKLQEN